MPPEHGSWTTFAPGGSAPARELPEHATWSAPAESNVVDVYVRHLRGKLSLEAIETVRGVGYRLAGDRR